MIWLICLLCGLLGFLGGKYNKLWRRIGVPSVITLATWLSLGWSLWWIVLFFSIFGVTTLPFTFFGNSIKLDDPDELNVPNRKAKIIFNFIWIWIYGYLLGAPSFFINRTGLLYALIPCISMGVLGTLSNISPTSKYLKWAVVEFIVWTLTAVCYALSIQR